MQSVKHSLLAKPRFLVVFALLWLTLLLSSPYSFADLANYITFSALGVIGAIFANSTGAGGGVVFIPMFNQLNFTDQQAVATSFAIQCFGMTAGAASWYYHYQTQQKALRLWQGFKRIIAVTTVCSVLALAWVFNSHQEPPASLHFAFSWFSLLLGLFILITVYVFKPTRERSLLTPYDYIALMIIGLLGGAITAWLSVGVGEILVIYLIIRRFDINMAIGAAVVVSAMSVWSVIGYVQGQAYWQVVLFAGPAAVLGGLFARILVSHLSAVKLKLFFACWLLISGSFAII